MAKKSNQSGFSTIEALLIAFILAIIGGIGYYVYHVDKQTTATLTTTSSPKTTVKASTTPATQYLVIKEWGVRMKLNATLTDAYYAFLPNETTAAYLSLKSLVTLAPDCAPTGTSIGVLFRQTPAEYQAALATPSDGSLPGNIKIGDYYYGYQEAQAYCFDASNTAAQTLFDSTQPRSGFATAEKTLEAVPAS